ncbi:DUF7019 family protein [Streptomyces sp. NBC_00658]|uniref:DUF7019 family protein n=1 Tax=Streptomyces sp. NBC_00658 TaxID=2975800 RepID=UPI00325019A4
MRYYLYVSDAKLDMLFEQIDRGVLKRISAEVKVDLKLASVTLTRAENPAPARAAKLRVVERYIERHHFVGDIEKPGSEYFRGRMAMTWGWLRWRADVDQNGLPRRDMVLFQGQQGKHTLGLAGGGRHVLAWQGIGEESGWGLTSLALDIFWALDQHISNAPELTDQLRGRPIREGGGFAAALNARLFHGPSQFVEFLAVPLAQDKYESDGPSVSVDGIPLRLPAQNTILGTPIYVALASEPEIGTTALGDPVRADEAHSE